MRRDTLKKFYSVHSWVGVITGILLFIIAFSGAVSVFGSPDLKIWSNPSLHTEVTVDPVKLDKLAEEYAVDIPQEFLHEVVVLLPGAKAFGDLYLLFETDHGPDERVIAYSFDPHTLALKERKEGPPKEVFAEEQMTLESFITHFHANLHLGRLGLILTGLLGLTLMASIVTGVIIHRKILKEMFSFRPLRSLRLMLTDSHKVLSVWGLLFHGMIGFTGAFLGLATVILLPAAAFVSFQGDQDKLLETFQPERMPVLSGEPADMQIDTVLLKSDQLGETTRSIVIMGWGDKNALAFSNTYGGDEMAFQTHSFQLQDGKVLETTTSFELVGGVSGPILDLMFPLHFGSFGGLPVRIIWALLGLSTALIAVTGMMIWVERRAYGAEGDLKPESYMRLSKLTIGSCSGMVVALAAMFWGQRLLPAYVPELFFVVWLLCLVYAFSRSNNYQSNRQLLGVAGLLLAAVPFVDVATLEHHLFNSMAGTHTHLAIIDVVLFLSGGILLYIAKRLPSERQEEQHRAHKTKQTALDEELEESGETLVDTSTSTQVTEA
ncbi:PepSY-associated TM helix domain-containing protein [Maricurvus nonylphenolicus]|uniref:PepSY-associated TM helix domain-containing protein n=1 Tax=Maricurvus nonylphenolicus TaxID=1008307 RepID=UPI0036F3D048